MIKWKIVTPAFLLALALGVAVWAVPRQQGKSSDHKQKKTHHAASQEPIPSVTDAQPVQDALKNTRSKAQSAGQVSCCISPPCDFCIAHLAMCQCRSNLQKHLPVCRECKGGWSAGEGNMAHIHPGQVKVMSADDVRKAVANSVKKP